MLNGERSTDRDAFVATEVASWRARPGWPRKGVAAAALVSWLRRDVADRADPLTDALAAAAASDAFGVPVGTVDRPWVDGDAVLLALRGDALAERAILARVRSVAGRDGALEVGATWPMPGGRFVVSEDVVRIVAVLSLPPGVFPPGWEVAPC